MPYQVWTEIPIHNAPYMEDQLCWVSTYSQDYSNRPAFPNRRFFVMHSEGREVLSIGEYKLHFCRAASDPLGPIISFQSGRGARITDTNLPQGLPRLPFLKWHGIEVDTSTTIGENVEPHTMPAFRLHAEAIPFVARIGANQYFHNWYESEAKELFGRRLIFYAIPGQRFGTTPRSHLLEAGTTWSGSLENSARDIDIREGDLTWNTNPYSSDQAPESRELELAWIEKNQDTLIKLSGQWIVLEGESLFSANNSLAEALQEAKKRGVRYPFVYKIPSESELPMAL